MSNLLSEQYVGKLKGFLSSQKYRSDIQQHSGRYSDSDSQHYLWQEKNQGVSWKDFKTQWGSEHYPHWIKTDYPHLIMPGDFFLCDLELGELWIGKMHDKRKATKIVRISDNMIRDYGNNYNGYALLPVIESSDEEN